MTTSCDTHIKRGQLLHDQGRYAEAEDFIKQALAEDPHRPDALLLLSWCQFHQENREKEALSTVERAIALEPSASRIHGLRALILSKLKRHQEAHEAAGQAIALDPDDPFGHAVRAQAFAGQQQWAPMEEAARQALARDGDHDYAQNLLTQALLLQGKTDENAFNVGRQLARDPDEPIPHFNAGYAALRRGDYRKAEEHFRESLRLDPSFESAREGMLESFRARSIVYRGYLKWSFWIAKFSAKYRLGIIIGLYVVYRLVVGALQQVSQLLAVLVVVLYLLFALWTHVARGVGNGIILLDRNARVALRRADVLEGLMVGGGVVLGLLLALAGALAGFLPLFVVGAALGAAAVPLAAAFNNDDAIGVKLYGALGAGVLLLGFATAILAAIGRDADSLVTAWVVLFVAAVWMSALGVKRE